jgi:hypothetical protein
MYVPWDRDIQQSHRGFIGDPLREDRKEVFTINPEQEKSAL